MMVVMNAFTSKQHLWFGQLSLHQ